MSPKEVVQQWVDAFNAADADRLAELYAEDAVNHQVALEPVTGQVAIRRMFQRELSKADMACNVENLFEDGEWAILEWRDPKDVRGCGLFQVRDDKIVFQRGYWDRLSVQKAYGLPMEP